MFEKWGIFVKEDSTRIGGLSNRQELERLGDFPRNMVAVKLEEISMPFERNIVEILKQIFTNIQPPGQGSGVERLGDSCISLAS